MNAIGEQNYYLLYGTMSTAACLSIAVGLRRLRDVGPFQWPLHAAPPASRLVACFVLQALGFAGLSQSLPRLQIPISRFQSAPAAHTTLGVDSKPSTKWRARCPFDFSTQKDAQGIQRISRHASLWSFAAVCLGAAAVVPSLPQAASLAMPTACALIGGAHLDSRARRGIGGHLPPQLEATTSHLPGLAIFTGAQGHVSQALRATSDEMKWLNAGLGMAVALAYVLSKRR